MAIRMNPQVVCDYPGCERRLTELGGKMILDPKGPLVIHPESSIAESADLCREHRRSLESWWARGDKGEGEPDRPDEQVDADGNDLNPDEDTTTAAPPPKGAA